MITTVLNAIKYKNIAISRNFIAIKLTLFSLIHFLLNNLLGYSPPA